MQKQKISFIYFDVGGVAVADFSKSDKWEKMLDDLKVQKKDRGKFNQLFDYHEILICTGEPIEIFVKKARKEFGLQLPDDYNMVADFVNRFNKNEPLLHLLDKLKKDFKLGLLTAQYPGMLEEIFHRNLIPRDIWSAVIDSSVEKVSKPDPRIYELAEQKAGVKPQEILFIDNRAELLEQPKSMGWQVFEYDSADYSTSTQKLERFIYSQKKLSY